MGLFSGTLSREEPTASAAREGSLADGCLADHSGGTAADLHGLPRIPCLQIRKRVYVSHPQSVKSR